MPIDEKRPEWGVFCQHDEWYVKNRKNGRIQRVRAIGDAGQSAALNLANRLNHVEEPKEYGGPTQFIVQLIDRAPVAQVFLGRAILSAKQGEYVNIKVASSWEGHEDVLKSAEGVRPWTVDKNWFTTKVAGENLRSNQGVVVWTDRPNIVLADLQRLRGGKS